MKNDSLFSHEFNDLYSSSKGPVEESEYVFIKGNRLEERFKKIDENRNFHIGEIGFGIGLNFLTTCRAWLKLTKGNQTLEFTSFDKQIFQLEDFKTYTSQLLGLEEYGHVFEKSYPYNIEGVQKISLFDGRVILNLVIGDISKTIEYLTSLNQVDAWFLDGFTPAKNPQLWSDVLLNAIGKTCIDGSTYSTYTSSGMVKKNLAQSGFSVEKIEGFSNKRHMLHGQSLSKNLYKSSSKKKIAIIGAGISGCTLAHVLSKKGQEVDLYEKSNSICSGASDHKLLVTYPRLSAHDTSFGRFSIQSYLHAIKFYESLNSKAWKKTGVLMLNHDEASKKRNDALLSKRSDDLIYQYVDVKEASDISGINLMYEGLYFKDAGYIIPNEMCNFLVDSPNISVFRSSEVNNLSNSKDKVTFTIGNDIFEYDEVCICTGSSSDDLIALNGSSLKRGQVSIVKSEESLKDIRVPVCAKGYISPMIDGIHLVGSSYSNHLDTEIREDEHASNLRNLKIIYSGDPVIKSGKAGLRAVSKDHVPIAGNLEGIFINTCHGSKASITAPICAEVVACKMLNLSPPLEKSELDALSPLRFN